MRLMKRRHFIHLQSTVAIKTYTVGNLWLWASMCVVNLARNKSVDLTGSDCWAVPPCQLGHGVHRVRCF